MTVEEIANKVIKRYEREEIDGVYLIFNEFKSVISQRVIVQRILPVQEIGRREVTQVEDISVESRERMGEAARSAGVSLQAPETSEMDREAVKFATAPVDYIYEQPPWRTAHRHFAALRGNPDLLELVGIGSGRARGPHDRHGFGHQQRQRRDRFAHADPEPGPPGGDYEGNYRDRKRRCRAVRQLPVIGCQLSVAARRIEARDAS